jgi:PIN domain nuclease of toxin-antitoxin system
MKLLLDTHILLWSLLQPELLSPRVREELERPDNEIWLSPITTWECLILAHKGRVVLEPDPVTWVRQVHDRLGFRHAPVTHEVAIQSRLVNLPHQDPADRFLAATAVIYELTLVTADQRLLGSPSLSVLASR